MVGKDEGAIVSFALQVKEALGYYKTIPLAFLGFGFDRAWIATVFYYDAFSLSMTDYYLFMLVLGAVSLVCAVRSKKLPSLCSSKAAAWFALGSMVVGSMMLICCLAWPSTVLKCTGLALGGAGSGVLYLMWADFYGRLTPLSVITYFSLGVLLGEALKLFFIGLPAGYVQFLSAALPLLSVGTAVASFRKLDEGQRSVAYTSLSLRGYPWKPVVIVTLIFFVASYFGNLLDRQNVGHSLGVLTVVLLMLSVVSPRARLFKVESLNQILLPLLVASFVLFLPLDSPFPEIVGFRLEAAYTMAFMLIFVVLSSVSYRYGVNPVWLSGIQRALRSAFEVFGWLLAAAIASTASAAISSTAVFVIQIIVLVVFVVAFFTEKGLSVEWQYRFADLSEEKLPAARLEQRVLEISGAYGLSERETDVLSLLATERSIDQIGEKLFIAPGTVKTHMHRIYQKLGVRSRVELLEFLADPHAL